MAKYFETIHEVYRDQPLANLFIFPYAGGGIAPFKKWYDKLPKMNIYVAQYPGREARFSEKAISDINILVDDIFQEIREKLNQHGEYYLFGHSMGTKVVYELALRIKHSNLPEPKGLIVSACEAPCYKEEKPICDLDDDAFIEELKKYDGTPKEILDNKELMNIFLPTLRADFKLSERYQDTKKEKLNSNILGLIGDQDKNINGENFMKWKEYTHHHFVYKYIKGDHMFINHEIESVIKVIKEFIDETESD